MYRQIDVCYLITQVFFIFYYT